MDPGSNSIKSIGASGLCVGSGGRFFVRGYFAVPVKINPCTELQVAERSHVSLRGSLQILDVADNDIGSSALEVRLVTTHAMFMFMREQP